MELKEVTFLIYNTNEVNVLESFVVMFGLLQELFVILTDSEFVVDWPIINIKAEKANDEMKVYFLRKTSSSPPRQHECPTNFLMLRDNFGDIISSWLSMREKFGPGFYLYLALRRGHKIYREHHFVNLVIGIEAIHRKKGLTEDDEAVIKNRVQRILEKVEEPTDKRWLSKKLKTSHEPTLERRIYDVIKLIPLPFEDKNLRAFSKRCAELRNEISHFGEQRHGNSYQEFISEITIKAEALSVLYHILILSEIGISKGVLKYWVYEGYRSYRHKYYLVHAGLLSADMLGPNYSPSEPNSSSADDR